MKIEPQLFLVFADIATNLNKKEEYLLCLRTHVRASLQNNHTPSLSVECYVELIEACKSIEDEVCYLRQLLTFLDDSLEALKSENSFHDVIQELEYLCVLCRNQNIPQDNEKKELLNVKDLLLNEIGNKISILT